MASTLLSLSAAASEVIRCRAFVLFDVAARPSSGPRRAAGCPPTGGAGAPFQAEADVAPVAAALPADASDALGHTPPQASRSPNDVRVPRRERAGPAGRNDDRVPQEER